MHPTTKLREFAFAFVFGFGVGVGFDFEFESAMHRRLEAKTG